MKPFRTLTAIEQLAAHFRAEIEAGVLTGDLPGVHRLAKQLGVSPKTVVAAVAQLEREGLLQGQGERRRNRIMPPEGIATGGLRVAFLLYEANDRVVPYMIDLQHRLQQSGHVAEFMLKTIVDLRRSKERVAKYVEDQQADAWLVLGGSREILEWFASRPVPFFALFGRRRGLEIAGAGPDKKDAMRHLVRKLSGLGHRRIVFLVREERRKPQPGELEKAFLDEMEAQGIVTGPYNLPDWEENPGGFHACLDRLFALSPPTALILDEAFFLTVAQQHLARRGILAPEDVSLICCDADPSFAWFQPSVAHIQWDAEPMVRRVVKWVYEVARGKDERRQFNTRAVFVDGGTIGPGSSSWIPQSG